MLFDSLVFALFFPAVWALYWGLRGRRSAQVWLLLLASYFFYGWWDWRFCGLIAGSTVLDYFLGRAMARTEDERRRKRLVTLSLIGNLGALGFFKYWGFFTTEFIALLERLGLEANVPLIEVVLPVGISFYTFQTLSYTLDIYRRELEPEPHFARFALFVAFFPQLVAGPIVRARDFLPQIRRAPTLTRSAFHTGLALIFWGLTKKIVIADTLGRELVDGVWAAPETYGGFASLLGIWGYALQIYGDFSGYSDVAIGTAMLLGFTLADNFNSPYEAISPRDFWRRWHISLGGNRGGAVGTYRNLMLTMTLGGLWHGASWMFVIWGVYHGGLLVVDRLLDRPNPTTLAGTWLRRLFVFQLICLGWVFFRSQETGDAWAVLGSLFAPRGEAVLSAGVWTLLAFGFVAHFVPDASVRRMRGGLIHAHPLVQGVVYALWLGLLMNMHSGQRPFIYFQF
ncbi:MAG: MBOAT family O-acyltransferase [Planctomycetota bacterium]